MRGAGPAVPRRDRYAASPILLCVAAMITGRSVETLAGEMYDKQDKRRDGSFSMMYIINNVGGMATDPGTIAVATGYPAFALCAIFAVLGVAYTHREQVLRPIGRADDSAAGQAPASPSRSSPASSWSWR
ncbi:MAG: hypothetical protein ACLT4Y_11240 [Bifidobacterium breve]